MLDVTSTSIKISWYEPEKPNGVIHAYRVYYMFLNQTLLHLPMLKNDASVGPPFYYTLINLSELVDISRSESLTNAIFSRAGAYTEYRIIVIAFTLKYDGDPSDAVIQRTDIAGPSAPQIINLTCHSQDALYLHWKRPASYYNSIDFYVINYKESSYSSYQQIQLNATAASSDAAVCRTNLLSSALIRAMHQRSLEFRLVSR